MKRDVERIRGLLTVANDPAGPDEQGHITLPPQAEHTLGLLQRSRRPQRVVLPGRRQLLAGAAVAGAGAVLAVGGRDLLDRKDAATPVAYTPPVLSLRPVQGQSARAFLLAFARRVDRLGPEPRRGAYQYTKTWGWWLNTAGDVPAGVVNAAVPTVTESWVADNDSGRRRSAYGEPLYPNPAQRKDAEAAGLVTGKGVEDRTFGPGKFPFPQSSAWNTVAPFSTAPR
ncbi:hypothetical protein [Streptomyces sp. SLBN-31]|uniref:hypothetical protein n=1 Tax=Streptomyces sp. SLBN-31 TaxID=2768444 RepID=UPI0011528D56|nr:hypothetical protein [Streptomyces sp. SLBN-31]TQJ92794.1 hypothetical protein FBY22_3720 [Streptomyces sp. SLBN-31]